jgi:hypothetical protein
MAHDIFEYGELVVTAFCGKEGDASIQITIGGYPAKYEKLDSKQAFELAIAILKRLQRVDGFCATD